ncbi:MAG: hypothetical protein Q7R56_02690, partial [Nanoarchaeota archaeon]|nr:hypothetical protein [Nanoarchaeota archaeon]
TGGGAIVFDDYVNISERYVSIDDSVFISFINQTARISFYNLTLINPAIVRNNITCPAQICTNITYSSGTLSFDITGFSTYETEESGSSERTSTSNPTGGSGSGRKYIPSNDAKQTPPPVAEKPIPPEEKKTTPKTNLPPETQASPSPRPTVEDPTFTRPSYATYLFIFLFILSLLYFEHRLKQHKNLP